MEPTIPKPPGLTGIFVPRAILEDPRLSLLEKVLFGLLDGFARGERGCFASNRYLARVLGRSDRCVRLALARLEAAGLVRRQGENRRTINTVSALAIASAQAEGGRKKTSGGGGRKLPPYSKVRDNNPPNPPKGGRRKFAKRKLTGEDYANGF